MVKSKAWGWEKEKNNIWLEPCEESYYYVNKWKKPNNNFLLDLGCGLGRHAILFAKNGFNVSAVDLSEYAIKYLDSWKEKEKLNILTKVCDMKKLPFENNSFDYVWAYHTLSHTDTIGFQVILAEIKRVLKPSGTIYLSLCSKDTWSYKDADYPIVDENTIIKTSDGPEKNVPHFYVNLNDIIKYFFNFELIHIRHVNDCCILGKTQNDAHYYIEAIKK